MEEGSQDRGGGPIQPGRPAPAPRPPTHIDNLPPAERDRILRHYGLEPGPRRG
jgi:hypothetical protein